MTVITRWDPFREFSTLQDRMNRLFRESYGPEGREESLTTPPSLRQWMCTKTSTASP